MAYGESVTLTNNQPNGHTLYSDDITCQARLAYGWTWKHLLRYNEDENGVRDLTFDTLSTIWTKTCNLDTTLLNISGMVGRCSTTFTMTVDVAITKSPMPLEVPIPLRLISSQMLDIATSVPRAELLVLIWTVRRPVIDFPSVECSSRVVAICSISVGCMR
jgi:hypothetical protein